jgi:hypothetical protein
MGCAQGSAASPVPEIANRQEPEIAKNQTHPLIHAANVSTERGVRTADLRTFASHVPTPPADGNHPAEWAAWVDRLVSWAQSPIRDPLPPWPLGRSGADESGPCSIPETAMRGITIRQLREIYARASARCVAEAWSSTADRTKQLRPEELTLYDLNTYLILPETRAHACSMVELIASAPAPPVWFVSHWYVPKTSCQAASRASRRATPFLTRWSGRIARTNALLAGGASQCPNSSSASPSTRGSTSTRA